MSDCHDGCNGSRREFLSGTLKLAGGAVVTVIGGAALASSGGSDGAEASHPGGGEYDWNEHLWAYLVDTTKSVSYTHLTLPTKRIV